MTLDLTGIKNNVFLKTSIARAVLTGRGVYEELERKAVKDYFDEIWKLA